MEAGIFKPLIKGRAEIKFIEDIWKDVFKDRIVLSNLHFHQGGVRLDEIVLLASITRHLNPKRIFEIGTCLGRTTVNLAANAKDLEVLYTFDLKNNFPLDKIDWLEQDLLLYQQTKDETGILIEGSPYQDRIIQLWGNSLEFDFSKYRDMDIIFIDGNKNYEYVYSDSVNAFNIISENGVIIWHDYNYADGVTKAVDDFTSHKRLSIYNVHKTTLGVYIK